MSDAAKTPRILFYFAGNAGRIIPVTPWVLAWAIVRGVFWFGFIVGLVAMIASSVDRSFPVRGDDGRRLPAYGDAAKLDAEDGWPRQSAAGYPVRWRHPQAIQAQASSEE